LCRWYAPKTTWATVIQTKVSYLFFTLSLSPSDPPSLILDQLSIL